jgi:paraquat-inducible protein B
VSSQSDPTSAGLAPPLLPTAVVRPTRSPWSLGFLWVFPAAALVAVIALVAMEYNDRGVILTINFREGFGLKPGDAVRYRGITVGQIRSVTLTGGSKEIKVRAELHREAMDLARAGTQFWIVRAQFDWTGFRGAETIIGANYIAVQPGQGDPRYEFVGLEEPPIDDLNETGGLQIVLQAERRGGLRRGVPVLYRQVRVGSVVSVGLSSDASAVEARVYIRPAYVNLVRDNTIFWNVSGFRFEGGFTGLKFDLDSAESVFAGGIALATPEQPGRRVPADQRFTLREVPEQGALTWRPSIPLGNPFLPEGMSIPRPVRAQLTYEVKGVIRNERTAKEGWVVFAGGAVVGPADVLVPPDKSVNAQLEIAGHVEAAGEPLAKTDRGAAWVQWPNAEAGFPAGRIKTVEVPIDVYLVGDPNGAPRFLSAAWMSQKEGGWEIDAAVTLGPNWHGAAAVGGDGALVGILIAPDKGKAYIVPASKP